MKSAFFRNILKPLDNGSMLHYSWYEAMHTRADIILHGENQDELEELSIKIYELICQLELVADRFKADSEIFKVNKFRSDFPVRISHHLFDILSDCIDAHKKTHGLFDITINSPDHSTESIKKVELFSDLKAVQILDNDTILDINGYVKGYAADKIRDLILTTSVKNALINLGNSSVLGVGDHPFGKGWKLKGLANAVTDITLYNECLTTSGNIVAERKHIRHPVSHEFISGERTISVVTPTGSLGEILSTSFLLATKEQALKISEQFKLSGKCLISSTG